MGDLEKNIVVSFKGQGCVIQTCNWKTTPSGDKCLKLKVRCVDIQKSRIFIAMIGVNPVHDNGEMWGIAEPVGIMTNVIGRVEVSLVFCINPLVEHVKDSN